MSREVDRLQREIARRAAIQQRRRARLRRGAACRVRPGVIVPTGLALGFVGGLCFFQPRSVAVSSPQRFAQDIIVELLDRQVSRWMYLFYARSRSSALGQQSPCDTNC